MRNDKPWVWALLSYPGIGVLEPVEGVRQYVPAPFLCPIGKKHQLYKPIIKMKRIKKKYSTPTVDVVELKTEKFLCLSNINPLFFLPFDGGGEDW